MNFSEHCYFSIMIISTQTYCERLKQCIVNISEKLYKKKILIKLAENVGDILNSDKPDTEVDYVAVVVDSTLPNFVDKCKRDVSLITPFFLSSRICIVNGACRDGRLDLVKDLIEFADQCNIPYYNGQIMDNKGCRITAERIVKLCAFSSGYDNGITNIVPIPKEILAYTSTESL